LATAAQRLTVGLWLGGLLAFTALDTDAPWLLVPATLAFALAAAAGVQARRQAVGERRLAAGQCVPCGYDLRHNPSPLCPECGHPVTTTSPRLAGGLARRSAGHKIA
jgi:hypothetical protein